jgi:hypothetical protein
MNSGQGSIGEGFSTPEAIALRMAIAGEKAARRQLGFRDARSARLCLYNPDGTFVVLGIGYNRQR